MRIYPIIFLILLSSCVETPNDGYANAGDPERQLAITTQTETIILASHESVERPKGNHKTRPS